MNDIIPPKPRPRPVDVGQPAPTIATQSPVQMTPVARPPVQPPRRRWTWLIGLIIGVIIVAVAAAMLWYFNAIKPVDSNNQTKQIISIEPGATLAQIASELEDKQLIRSQLAFNIYTRIEGVEANLQTGSYRVSPSESLGEIIKHLTSGKADEITITFYPGATLYDPRDSIKDEQRTDVYTMLRRAGFSDQQVRAGLEKKYDHPLLTDKPANASLEGYVLGDTYRFGADASVEDILMHTFDVFYQRINERDLVAKFKKQGLSLYRGLTLASIIEREVSGRVGDQKQVSQVFHLRLEKGMPLGADATFQYVAMQRNVAPSINIDSPYNTRINKGLPPGPISSPHISAIEAAAEPSKGDYLYFVSGDDGTTHFARTDAEHQANTRKYCTTLCQQS